MKVKLSLPTWLRLRRPQLPPISLDLVGFALGLALVTVGAWWVYAPAGPLVLGGVLMWLTLPEGKSQ